jgi:hypothetical protein
LGGLGLALDSGRHRVRSASVDLPLLMGDHAAGSDECDDGSGDRDDP